MVLVPAGALPGLPILTWKAAASDYCVTTGVLGKYAEIAYVSVGGPGGDRHGALRFTSNLAPNSSKLRDITDGLSNTFLMGERTGGKDQYIGIRKIPNGLPSPYNMLNGGGWGDPLNGEHWLGGSVRNPSFPPVQGQCAINCSNIRGSNFHSFHASIAQFVMADGSVQNVSDAVDPFVMAARITREKSETPLGGEF